jgi:type IV pilus assembly protein PilQ
LVAQIDIPIRQVLIEARIVIANTDFRKEIGVRWGGIGVDNIDGSLVQIGGGVDSLDSDPGSPIEFFNGGTTDLGENMMVDLGVSNPAGAFALSVLRSDVLITAELSALQDDGHAEIVSQPKIITGDKQQATIESGQEIPYQMASSSGATAVQFKEAVLKLDVTPQITPDNRIIMDLKINQDSVSDIDAGSGVPIIDVTQLETQVLVGNGQTVVLGGIYQNQEVTGETKVPVLGDIPYLGRAFRKNIRSNSKTELLIFITPKILTETLEN